MRGVGLCEIHGVVAGAGADVHHAPSSDVAEYFSTGSDVLPWRPGQLFGDGGI